MKPGATLQIIMVAMTAFLMFGCSGKQDTPKHAVKGYVNAMTTGEDTEARTYLFIDPFVVYNPMTQEERANFDTLRIKKVLYNPDKTRVKVATRFLYKDGKESEMTFYLAFSNYAWQIQGWDDVPVGDKWKE